MTQKIALVTGESGRGEQAIPLAQRNVHVLLAGRDRAKATEAALKLQQEGLPVEAIALDVNDANSIAVAAKDVEKKFGHLDILVNNAGILVDDVTKKSSEQTLDAWRETFDTNVFAVVAVTQVFLPLLRKSEAGRIVNVSSILGSLTLHSDPTSGIYDFKVPAYDASKSAVNAWTVHLAHELRDTPIKVNAIHPGSVKTDMNSHGDIDVAEGAKSSVELALIGADGPNGSFTHLGKTLPW